MRVMVELTAVGRKPIQPDMLSVSFSMMSASKVALFHKHLIDQ